MDEEKRRQLFEHIRADQQRVVDINDVLTSLQQLQKAAGSDVEAVQRWQSILDALDEDHDGKIEFKHLLAVSWSASMHRLQVAPFHIRYRCFQKKE